MPNLNTIQKRFQEPAGWQWDRFINKRNASLRYGFLKAANPAASIVFVEGLSEYAEKTFELSRDFNKQNCDFWVLDRQGQGRSGRFFDGQQTQHTHGFNHDVDDLVQLVDEIIKPDKPVILMGNSTGGLIALMAAKERPEIFNAAIATSPLLGFPFPRLKITERILTWFPLPKFIHEKPVSNDGNWLPRGNRNNIDTQGEFSGDPIRNKIHDYWMEKDKELRVGPSTYGWARVAFRAFRKVRSPRYLKKIEQPVLIFTAEDDFLVDNKQVFKAARRAPNIKHVHLKNAKHELLMETDTVRDEVINKSMELINSVCNHPKLSH